MANKYVTIILRDHVEDVSRACGISPQAVYQWRHLKKGVPAGQVMTVAPIINFPPHEIRPDVFHPPKQSSA